MDLLFTEKSEEEVAKIREAFEMIFSDPKSLELMDEVLPHEVDLTDKTFSVDYRIIQIDSTSNDIKIMLIITDITLQSKLSEQVKQDEEKKELIVNVATDKGGFVQFYHDLESLFEKFIWKANLES